MDRLFIAIGRTVAHHRWKTVAVWLLVLTFGLAFAPRLQEVFDRETTSGDTGDSHEAAELVSSEFKGSSPFPQQLVFTSDSRTVDDPAYAAAAAPVIEKLEGTAHVTGVNGFFRTGNRQYVSPDGRTTYAVVNLDSPTYAEASKASAGLLDAVAAVPMPDGFKAYLTGAGVVMQEIDKESKESLSTAESVGLPIALIALMLVFGALVAAGLPLVMGMIAIIVALGLAFLVGQRVDLSVFLESAGTMLGLGLGIDYSLFIITRYRAERRAGRDVNEAVVQAVRHAGKAIAFAGFMVAIAMLALLAAESQIIVSVGIGGVLMALVSVAVALTLLPAVIALLGDRIERPQRLTRLIARTHRGGFWTRWAQVVMRRPLMSLGLGLAVIALLAAPALSLRTGSMGVNVLPNDAQSKLGYEVLQRDFGPGLTSPVQIVVRAPAGIDDPGTVSGIAALTERIKADPRFGGAVSITTLDPRLGVAQYQALYANDFAGVPPELRPQLGQLINLDRAGDTTIVLGLLAEDPDSEAAVAAVHDLRDTVVPAVTELRGDTVLVGGSTALQIDAADALYSRFPVIVGIILGTTFLLLLLLFRSILIPLKAVVMNLLSVGAAYGLLVFAFQNGFGERALGFTSPGFIDWITPVLQFAILFGLSMDYEIFLLSRIRELHDRGYSNEDAVAGGLERTGGIITGAALIMIVIFGAFTLSSILVIKELGFALAVAVLIDATLVRVVLVPATMRLLGDWNWKIPGWLGRVLPKVELEPAVTLTGNHPAAVTTDR